MPSRKNRVRLRFRSLRADWQKHELLTQKIIGIFYPIYNELGHGFLENVYQKSFAVLVREQALNYCAQMPIKIFYHNVDVGEYFADLVVESAVLVELKAVSALESAHEKQVLNYLLLISKSACYLTSVRVRKSAG